jgi:hypothetical protein
MYEIVLDRFSAVQEMLRDIIKREDYRHHIWLEAVVEIKGDVYRLWGKQYIKLYETSPFYTWERLWTEVSISSNRFRCTWHMREWLSSFVNGSTLNAHGIEKQVDSRSHEYLMTVTAIWKVRGKTSKYENLWRSARNMKEWVNETNAIAWLRHQTTRLN